VKPRKNIPKASTVKTGVSTPKGKTIAADTKPLGTKEESVNSLETKAESNHKPEGLSKSVEDKSDKRIEKTGKIWFVNESNGFIDNEIPIL